MRHTRLDIPCAILVLLASQPASARSGRLEIAQHAGQPTIAEFDPNGSVLREVAFAAVDAMAETTADLSHVLVSPRGGAVVAMRLDEGDEGDQGTGEEKISRAGLVWLGTDLLPTQSAELALGSASASIAEIVPLAGGAFVVRVEVTHSAVSGFSEIQRVEADGWVAWRHRVLRGLGGADAAPSALEVTARGRIVVTLASRSGSSPIRVLLDADGSVLGARAGAEAVASPLAAPLPGFPTNPLRFEGVAAEK